MYLQHNFEKLKGPFLSFSVPTFLSLPSPLFKENVEDPQFSLDVWESWALLSVNLLTDLPFPMVYEQVTVEWRGTLSFMEWRMSVLTKLKCFGDLLGWSPITSPSWDQHQWYFLLVDIQPQVKVNGKQRQFSSLQTTPSTIITRSGLCSFKKRNTNWSLTLL